MGNRLRLKTTWDGAVPPDWAHRRRRNSSQRDGEAPPLALLAPQPPAVPKHRYGDSLQSLADTAV